MLTAVVLLNFDRPLDKSAESFTPFAAFRLNLNQIGVEKGDVLFGSEVFENFCCVSAHISLGIWINRIRNTVDPQGEIACITAASARSQDYAEQ